MTASLPQSKTFTGNAGKAKGREFSRRTGECWYINHSPYFAVTYWPNALPEQVSYLTWELEVIVSGCSLRGVYENLKANSPDVLQESEGPQDAAHPYIEKIEYRMRL